MFIYIKLEGYFVGFVINQKLHLYTLLRLINIVLVVQIYILCCIYTTTDFTCIQVSNNFFIYHLLCKTHLSQQLLLIFSKHSPPNTNQNDLDLCDTRYDWHTRCQSLHWIYWILWFLLNIINISVAEEFKLDNKHASTPSR
jgi:hypothetical protein